MARNRLIGTILAGAVAVAACVWVFFYSPAASQARRLRIARQHADLVRPQLEADPRFAGVWVGGYTGDGGGFWVGGKVTSKAGLDALRALILASEPPLEIRWSVEVIGVAYGEHDGTSPPPGTSP